MPNQDSPPDETVYRFITEKDYKETLSGRVRAACVNCRRKKIRCSGDVPCSTCREKGTVCEGQTERKRPKKVVQQGSSKRTSSISGQSSSTRSSRQQSLDSNIDGIAISASPLQRPVAALQAYSNIHSNDSGYSSGQFGTPPDDLLYNKRPSLNALLAVETNSVTQDKSTGISPTVAALQEWSFNQDGLELCETQSGGTANSNSSQIPPGTSDGGNMWWHSSGTSRHTPNQLISAAESLERQAHMLRRLASGHETNEGEESRRQTVLFPLQSSSLATSPYDAAFSPHTMDDLALGFPHRSGNNNITPTAADFASFWDVHPGLSFQQHNLPQAAGLGVMPMKDSAPWQASISPTSHPAIPDTMAGHTELGASSSSDNQGLKNPQFSMGNEFQQLHRWPE